MKFIHSKDPKEGTLEMARYIIENINLGRHVLWLLCGGSNVPYAVMALDEIRKAVDPEDLDLLSVGQTDERYGDVGHKDSNWKQLQDAGFKTDGFRFYPMLNGESLEETAEEYANTMASALSEIQGNNGLIVAQFGIGADGHIAGILPNTPAVLSEDMVCGYESIPFTRLTLTPSVLHLIDAAYVFAFGATKKKPLLELRDKDLSIDDQPCAILKDLKESHVYTDQI